ncbi:hypothetical protein J7K24_01065 [bacterium]|nr:hypothetical protein [bacterium]
MLKDYTPEQFWKLYEKLPKDLQDAIFSEETANNIYTVCDRYEIDEVPKVAKIVGFVLLGVLPPDELYETLLKELDIDPEVAKRVNQEIIRFIFYPVRTSLEGLYGIAGRISLEEIESRKPNVVTQNKEKEAIVREKLTTQRETFTPSMAETKEETIPSEKRKTEFEKELEEIEKKVKTKRSVSSTAEETKKTKATKPRKKTAQKDIYREPIEPQEDEII